MATRKEIQEKLDLAAKRANEFYAKYPNDDDVPLEEAQAIDAELAELAGQMKQFIKVAEIKSATRQALGEFASLPAGDIPAASDGGAERKGSTPGEQFLSDPQFKQWWGTMAPNGRISEKSAFASPQVAIEAKLITGLAATSAGAVVRPDRQAGVQGVEVLRRPLNIRDLITVLPTASDSIEYVQMVSQVNNAAPVAEATATTGASGTKPESTFALARVTDTIKTIAHWVAVTTRALADAPQIRAIIDQFLLYGLAEELEDQIVAGSGTGENFTGILNQSGIQLQAFTTDATTTMLHAKTKVRTVGRDVAQAYILNPLDAEALELVRVDGATGVYVFGGPAAQNDQLRVWRLPVVENEAVPVGTGLVGNFRRVVLYDRQQASIQASNSHADFFIRNLVAVLAELRAGLGNWQPKSIVKFALTA